MNIKNRFLLLIFFFGVKLIANAQCPSAPNIDFETGGYSNWDFCVGLNGPAASTTPTITWTCPPLTGLPAPGAIAITSGAGVDAFGPIPVVYPASTNLFSLKLGSTRIMQQSERARYLVTVPSGVDYIVLNYHFAIVLENPTTGPPHDPAQKPYFQVRLYDAAMTLVPCSQYTYNADNLPGFTLSGVPSPNSGDFDVWYRDWQSASIIIPASVSPATIEFIVADCSVGGHFGYTYIDVDCSTFPDHIRPCYPGSFTLPAAPPGYATYTWYEVTSPSWTWLGTVAAGAIFPPLTSPPLTTPSVATDYALVLTPNPGFGCPETLYVHVDPIYAPVAALIPPFNLCDNDPGRFVDAGSTPGGTYTSSNTSVATVDPLTGFVRPVAGAGGSSATITYTVWTPPCGTATTTTIVNIIAAPTATVTAPNTACEGDIIQFCIFAAVGMEVRYTDPATGSTGMTHTITLAESLTGFCVPVVAIAPGITFHFIGVFDPVTHCSTFYDQDFTVLVCPIPDIGAIMGDDPLCAGDVRTYTVTTNLDISGVWSCTSVPAGIATITPGPGGLGFDAGILTTTPGATGGVVTIQYSVGNCCSTVVVTRNITVNPRPNMPTVTYTGCVTPCPGMPLTFVIHGDPNTRVFYNWIDPITPTITFSGSVLLNGFGDGTVTLFGGEGLFHFIVTHVVDETTGCRNELAFEIRPIDIRWPYADFWEDPKRPCEDGWVTFTIHGTPGASVQILPSSIPPVLLDPVTGLGTFSGYVSGTTTFSIGNVTGVCCTHFDGDTYTITPLYPPPPTVTLSVGSGAYNYLISVSGGDEYCSPYTVNYQLTVEDHPDFTGYCIMDMSTTIASGGSYSFYFANCRNLGVPMGPGCTGSPVAGWPSAATFPPGACSLHYASPIPSGFTHWDHAGIYAVNLVSVTSAKCGCSWDITGAGGGKSSSNPNDHGNTAINVIEKLSITPNPNIGSFTISGGLKGATKTKEANIIVTDLLGKTIYTDVAAIENGSINKLVDLGKDVANGIYMIRIKNAEVNEVIKFTLDR